jgi:hypothetical protein
LNSSSFVHSCLTMARGKIRGAGQQNFDGLQRRRAGGVAVAERTSGHGDVGEPQGGIISETIGPEAGWLLEGELDAETVYVNVRDGVAGEGAVLSEELVSGGPGVVPAASTIFVMVEGVKPEPNVSAGIVVNIRQIANWIISVFRVQLFLAPTVGEPGLDVVLVALLNPSRRAVLLPSAFVTSFQVFRPL